MELFSLNSSLLADVSFLFQFLTIILIISGLYLLKKKRDYNKHGFLMFVGVILHSISIVVVMIPSMLRSTSIYEASISNQSAVFILHEIIGSIALILGVWLTLPYILTSRGIKNCFKKKKLMKTTLSFWILALILGIYIYFWLYFP